MKKRSLLVLAIGSLLSLVSCGSTRPDTVVDQVLPEGNPSSVKTIIFWHCLGHDKTNNLNKIVDAFNQEYDGYYNVKAVKLEGDYDGLHTAVKTKLASGEVPALCMGYPDSFSEYISANIKRSNILRLDNFIDDEVYGYDYDEENDTLLDFVPGYYHEGTGYQFNGTWSLPMYKSTEVMYYNNSYLCGANPLNVKLFNSKTESVKTAFFALYNVVAGKDGTADPEAFDIAAQALREFVEANDGYTYDVPEKWDELMEVAQQMLDDRNEMGITDEFYPVGYDSDANMIISKMAQNNIPYTTNFDGEEGKEPKDHILFNNSQAKALVTRLIGYINDGLMITKNSLGGDKYTNTYFNDGKTAFTIGSTGGSSYNISSNFNVKLAPVPYENDNPLYIQQGPSICFFDNLDGYIHKGAWLFYKKLAEPLSNCKLALENSYDPVRVSSYEEQYYQEWIDNAGLGLKYDIPNITKTLKDNYMTSPVFVGSSTCRTEMGMLIKYIDSSLMSVDAAFQTAYNNCLLAVK